MNYDIASKVLDYLEWYDWWCFANTSKDNMVIWKRYTKDWRYIIHAYDYSFIGDPVEMIYDVLDDISEAYKMCKKIIKIFHGISEVKFKRGHNCIYEKVHNRSYAIKFFKK
jgi:hypothetical protein